MSGADWKRKVTGVCWRDVWAWAAQMRDEYGYWVTIWVSPPMPSQEGKIAYHVAVRAVKYREGGKTSELVKSVGVGEKANVPPEVVALQVVSAMYTKLDREAWEAERAAGQGTLPF